MLEEVKIKTAKMSTKPVTVKEIEVNKKHNINAKKPHGFDLVIGVILK